MQGFLAISLLVYVVACSVVGIRLLLLTRRTRQVPELLVGLGFSLVGLLGYPIAMLSGFGQGTVAAMSPDFWYVGVLLMDAGLGCIYAFTARVFRPGRIWAVLLATALTLSSIVTGSSAYFALKEALPSELSYQVTSSPILVGQIASSIGFAWIGIESWLQLTMARRRQTLGLGDRVVANRFLLWVLFAAFAVGMSVINTGALLADVSAAESKPIQAAMAVLGLTASISMYLAFLPPAAYLRWLRGEGGKGAEAHA